MTTTLNVGNRVRVTSPQHGYYGATGIITRKHKSGLHVEVEYKKQVIVLREDEVEAVG